MHWGPLKSAEKPHPWPWTMSQWGQEPWVQWGAGCVRGGGGGWKCGWVGVGVGGWGWQGACGMGVGVGGWGGAGAIFRTSIGSHAGRGGQEPMGPGAMGPVRGGAWGVGVGVGSVEPWGQEPSMGGGAGCMRGGGGGWGWGWSRGHKQENGTRSHGSMRSMAG